MYGCINSMSDVILLDNLGKSLSGGNLKPAKQKLKDLVNRRIAVLKSSNKQEATMQVELGVNCNLVESDHSSLQAPVIDLTFEKNPIVNEETKPGRSLRLVVRRYLYAECSGRWQLPVLCFDCG